MFKKILMVVLPVGTTILGLVTSRKINDMQRTVNVAKFTMATLSVSSLFAALLTAKRKKVGPRVPMNEDRPVELTEDEKNDKNKK